VKPYYKTIFIGGGVSGSIFALSFLIALIRTSPEAAGALCGSVAQNNKAVQHYSAESQSLVGVNLGGWLCLEDWFFSGSVGRYVSTPDQMKQGQGACLPPLVPGPMEKPWSSEGELVHRLSKEKGRDFAAAAMKAHREAYITTQDFEDIATLGIQTIRIPLTWTIFADALKEIEPEMYGRHDPDVDTAIVPDPYFVNELLYATIPRKWLLQKLHEAADRGLRVILDLHNMPGGSSVGTYSGIWPRMPKFWDSTVQVGPQKGKLSLEATGLLLVQALIAWVEKQTDLLERGAVWGICFLNEPGHLSAGKNWTSESQILNFLQSYSNLFRASSLPAAGVRLYIQVIETAFQDFGAVVPAWYNNFYTQEERYQWAVIARHYYMSWSAGACDGRLTWGGAYRCDEPLDKVRGILAGCSYAFAGEFKANFDGLRSVTEWSMGTYWDTDLQCADFDVLRISFEENVKGFTILHKSMTLEPIFWTWKIPFAPKFRFAWSLKFFSGLTDHGETNSNGSCVVGQWAQLDGMNQQNILAR